MASIIHKTITQGRKTIVFGMPGTRSTKRTPPRKAGVALAKEVQEKYDLIVARKEDAPQFGLAFSGEGAKSGAYSAAAIVADIVAVDSWIYVLEIETSTWICSGRDGYILPAGDRIYENRDEARRAFHALNPSSFKMVYIPASWKDVGSDDDDLSDTASDIEETDILDFIEYSPPKWARLTTISSVGTILKGGAALAILLSSAAFGGWTIYTSESAVEMTPEQRAAMLARQASEIAARNTRNRQTLWASFDANRPWHNAPDAAQVLETCIREIGRMPTRPVGYEVENVYCNGVSVDASVKRTTGYSIWLEEWASAYPDIELPPTTPETRGISGAISRIFRPGGAPRRLSPLTLYPRTSSERVKSRAPA